MARNKTVAYINKLLKMDVPNGYTFDIANYLYNPAHDCEYPAFHKVIAEDEKTQTISRVYYFKHYDGTGEYTEDIFQRPKVDGWTVTKQKESRILETSSRFSVNRLLKLIPA